MFAYSSSVVSCPRGPAIITHAQRQATTLAPVFAGGAAGQEAHPAEGHHAGGHDVERHAGSPDVNLPTIGHPSISRARSVQSTLVAEKERDPRATSGGWNAGVPANFSVSSSSEYRSRSSATCVRTEPSTGPRDHRRACGLDIPGVYSNSLAQWDQCGVSCRLTITKKQRNIS